MPTQADTVASERRFHNQRFSVEGGLRPQSKYYFALQQWRTDLQSAISENAKDAEILEYGCGTGALSLALAASGAPAKVLGIDISDVAIADANAKAATEGLDSKAEFLVMDAHDLNLPERSIDLVFGSGIIHHLDTSSALREISRVLRPEGVAVFGEPLGTNPIIRLYRWLTPSSRTADEHPFVDADFAECRRWFGSVEVKYYGLLSIAAVPFRDTAIGSPLQHLLARLDSFVLNRLGLWRLAWMSLLVLKQPLEDKPFGK